MSIFELYLIFTVVPALGGFAVFMLIAGGFIGGATFLFYEEMVKGIGSRVALLISILKYSIPVAVVIVVFLPNEAQMKYIIGGSYVTNIENIEKLPPNMIDAANKFLEKMNEAEK